MAASVFDSALFRKLFPTGEVGRLFTDSAEVRAMVLVEGALAKAQGALGVIPQDSAGAIHRASLEIPFDPGALAEATGQNGVSVPGLVALMREEMNAPEHSAYLHWGATSQDIIDTGLMLRLRQALGLIEDDLKALIQALATQAEAHAHTPMTARTLGQTATPTSWGAVLTQWGMPLIDALEALDALRDTALWVSLSGASGTSSALGSKACETRAALAKALGLKDPERSWHSDRTPVLRILDWMMQISATLGGMGHSLIGLSASGVDEITLPSAGASSTMPHKSNPVAPSALVALSHQATGLRASLQTAALHQHQRDGAAWFTEWMVLPQIVLSCASALGLAKALAQDMRPKDAQMQAALSDTGANLGLIHAEALSFALAAKMPRPEAQAETKKLCQQALSNHKPLSQIAHTAHPDLPSTLFDASAQLGQAPALALHFVARAKTCVT